MKPIRQDRWFDENNKFLGWPKGKKHAKHKLSPWGDLRGSHNRAKFKSYLEYLEGAGRFIEKATGLRFYRSLSENVKMNIRKRLQEVDPQGLAELNRINKAMTRAITKGKEFDHQAFLTKLSHERQEKLKKRLDDEKSVIAEHRKSEQTGWSPYIQPEEYPMSEYVELDEKGKPSLRPEETKRLSHPNQWEIDATKRQGQKTPDQTIEEKRYKAIERFL